MNVEPGRHLGHYRLLEKLGEGAMGAIWKALDLTLDREVAIKFVHPHLAAQPERLARFDREAKLLASLNHQNIAAVYGFQEHEGLRFVVMELVDGEDLSQRLERGALPVDDALEFAVRIAEALAAAHERGVVHRDLKPANVRVTPDDIVKVLDFGLAKSLDSEAGGIGPGSTSSPTISSGGTALGTLLGTAAYMSPEQARGKPVDRRADLWAFGCVLYEMLTGQRAFEGETVTDTLATVIRQEPNWDLLPPSTPAATRRLLRRCLQKDLDNRVRDAADARLELLEPDEPVAGGGTAATPARPGSPLRLVAAAVAGAAAVGLAWLLTPAPSPTGPSKRLPLPHRVTFTGDLVNSAAIGGASAESDVGMDLSADGRTVVYLTRERDRAVLIDLDGGGSQTLFTAEAGMTFHDAAWSPDGDRVHLMTWPYSERVLSVPRFGGEPRSELDLSKLAGLNGIFVRPLRDDRWLVFGNHNTVYIGHDPASLEAKGTQLDGDGVFRIEGLDLLLRVASSDDGRLLAFEGSDSSGHLLSGVTDETGASNIVAAWSGLTPVSWAEENRALYLWRLIGPDIGDLLRVACDPANGQPLEEPVLVYPRLRARSVQVSADGQRLVVRAGDSVFNLQEISVDATPDASDNPARARTRGTGRWRVLGFLPGGTLLAGLDSGLGWELFSISDDGAQRSLVRRESASSGVMASPDGDRIALTIEQPENGLLIHDVSDNRSRTIPVPAPLSNVAWSPDGTRLVGMTKNSADSIVVVDVESDAARSVTLACGDQCEFAYEGVVSGPEWPYFAITSEVDTWIVNAETGDLRHVADSTWNILAWQDSFIYFSRGPGQTEWPGNVLFRVPAEGGAEERLLDLPLPCESFRVDPARWSVTCNMDESRLDVWVVDGLRDGWDSARSPN